MTKFERVSSHFVLSGNRRSSRLAPALARKQSVISAMCLAAVATKINLININSDAGVYRWDEVLLPYASNIDRGIITGAAVCRRVLEHKIGRNVLKLCDA